MREHMVAAWKRGWTIIPLRENTKLPNLPKGHPFLYVKPTREEYGEFDFGNYAVVCGKISGITVLDIDEPEGVDSINAIDGVYLGDLYTPVAKTPGGRHYFFKYSPEVKTGVAVLGRGVDIRNDGSYVVGVGSVIDGNEYEWMPHSSPDDVELQDAPEWLKRKVGYKIAPEPKRISGTIKNGQRNDYLASATGYLFTKFADYGTVEHLVKSLNTYACETPLDEEEIESIVRSISRYHV